MSGFYFSQEQIDNIREAYDQAKLTSNYYEAYRTVSNMLPSGPVRNWFKGAEQANAGEGAFAVLIREYSKRQMELRGIDYSPEKMQSASDAVAQRALEDILDPKRQQADGTWLAPNMEDIANNDATAVGDVLFGGLGPDDSAGGLQNAGWSGTVLFSVLGSDQTHRLTGAGGAGLNTIDDFKNVLFAFDAYAKAHEAARSVPWDQISSFDSQIFTDIGIGLSTPFAAIDELWELAWNNLSSLLSGDAQEFGDLIASYGPGVALDWIRSTYAGSSFAGETTENNFAANASSFFTGLSAQEQQSASAKLLPTQKQELVQLAMQDAAVRNALYALSPISITLPSYSQDVSLLDEETGEGALSEKWINDRSRFLSLWMQAQAESPASFTGTGIQVIDGEEPAIFHDVASDLSIRNFSFAPEVKHYTFGSTGSDSLLGGNLEDHLYGGTGSDVVDGGDGDDHIEGNGGADELIGGSGEDEIFGGEGNDTIEGGDNSDILRGDAGNDVIDGGAGDDTLHGGEEADELNGGDGFDTYFADSQDTITDSDKRGQVRLDEQLLNGGSREEDDPEGIYHSANGAYTYRLSGDTLTVNDGLTIENFSDGDLGIDLITKPVPVPVPPVPVPTPVPTPASPLILDLDGDGIETVGHDADIHFDHGGDSFRELSGFVAPDDALLALDLNANGVIDNGRELFGNSTLLSDGSAAENGFEALRELDSNEDGVIDASDELFGDLRLFQDLDQDGLTDEGELLSLEEAGIDQLFLDYTSQNFVDASGNAHKQVGQYTNSDGQTFAMTDVWFDTNITDTVGEEVEIAPEILLLPNARGFGRVHSLHQAMARDESGELQQLVEQFASATSRENRLALVEEIIFKWTGQEGEYRQHFHSPVDTRKVGAIGEFLGMDIDRPRGTGQVYARLYKQKFEDVVSTVLFQMSANGHLKPFFEDIPWTEQASGVWHGDFSSVVPELFDVARADADAALDLIQDFVQAIRGVNVKDTINVQLLRNEVNQFAQDPANGVDLDNPADSLVFAVVNGVTDGRDVIDGTDSDDVLYGLGGFDTIRGGQGDDVLTGGEGNDELIGGEGSDTYRFGIGDGRDRVTNNDSGATSEDVVHVYGGLTQDDVSIYRQGDDLVVEINGTEDALRISSHFEGEGAEHHHVDAIVFDDGSRVEVGPDQFDQINVRSQNITEEGDELHGTSANDTLDGLGGNDQIFGKKGDDQLIGGAGQDELHGDGGDDVLSGGQDKDRLYGGAGKDELRGEAGHDNLLGDDGDDILIGGAGDDYLVGGKGNDTYRFNLGDGLDYINNQGAEGDVDVLELGPGIVSGDVLVRSTGRDLLVLIGSTGEEIRIREFFVSDSQKIQSVVFTDPNSPVSQWSSTELETLAFTAGDVDDELHGDDTDNVLNGLGGDDVVGGHGGNDILRGDTGNDNVDGGAGDDQLFGGDGDDLLSGGRGDDTLDGGAGNDHLSGGSGSDRYLIKADGSHDVIQDYDNTDSSFDRVEFEAGITSEHVSYRRTARDLVVDINKGGVLTTVTIQDTFYNTNNLIDSLEFADGTSVQLADVLPDVTQYVGNADSETIYGSANDDMLWGREGADRIYGRDGNDQLVGEGGNDTLMGEGGDDLIVGGEGDDSLRGGHGQDELQGGVGDDDLNGGAGEDRLFGQEGDDRIQGGDADDSLIGGLGNDRLYGGAGDDKYYFTAGDGQDVIHDHEGSITIYVSDIDLEDVVFRRNGLDLDIHFEGAPNDKITIDNYYPAIGLLAARGIGFFDSASGFSQVFSADDINSRSMEATENDDVIRGDSQANTIDGLAGNDIIYGDLGDDSIDGSVGNDTLFGEAGNDTLNGGDGEDHLEGGDGDDILTGGAGDDTLQGGKGSDRYVFGFGDGRDTIINYDENGNDVIQFSDGVVPADVAVTRTGNHLTLLVGASDQIVVRNFFQNEGNSANAISALEFKDGTVWNKETLLDKALIGGAADDSLLGYSTDDLLVGNGGADTLQGNDGNDQLDGGLGNDTLAGGLGNDVLTGGQGDDTLQGGQGDDVYRFSKGDGNDSIYDTAGQDQIEFVDIASTEVVVRREGNDLRISVPSTGDAILVTSQFSGTDAQVQPASLEMAQFADGVSWTFDDLLTQAVEGTESDDLVHGFDVDESISVQGGADEVYGYAGNDTIAGGAGDDRLHGGDGQDSLFGDAGDDELHGGDADDALQGGAGADILHGDQGDDTLFGGEGVDVLSGGAGADELQGGQGNDELSGDSGADLLSGGDGADVLHGGSGNDTLNGDAGDDVLHGDGGTDTLSGGDGNDELYGTGTLSGDAGDDIIEGRGVLDGGAGNDQLTGKSSDTLIGGSGDDVLIANTDAWQETSNILEGGTGADQLFGSYGNDTYRFNLGDGQDVLVETPEGEAYSNVAPSQDTLEFGSGISAEDLSFVRTGKDLQINHANGTDGILVKNWFQEPNDHYKVNRFVFADGTEWTDLDVEEASVTVGTDGADTLLGYRNLNEEVFAGEGNDKVWGREGNDVLHGEAGDDYLDGEAGDDRLVGGVGNDNLVGRTGADRLEGGIGDDTLQGGAGQDELLGGAGEDSLFGGEGNDQINGGADNDYVEAGAGNDVVSGGDGDDQINGGAGDDTLSGGAGNDRYVFAAGSGNDTIDNSDGGNDGVFLTGGATEDRITFTRDGDDLVLLIDEGAEGCLRVTNHFLGGDHAIDWVQPDGGYMISTSQINQRVAAGESSGDFDSVVTGTSSGEQLVGGNTRDLMEGLAGDDTLFAMGGDDQLEGGAGADQLYGGNGSGTGSGNDTLIGGDGNDTLVGEDGDDSLAGGAGNDSYYYKAGQGVDVIDNTGGGSDGVFFLDGLDRNRLSYHQDGNDLVILVDGDLEQQVRVTDHFLGGENAISYIQPTDGGNAIMASQLAELLTAMPGEGGSSGDEMGGGSEGGDTSGEGGDTGSGTEPGTAPTPELGGDDVLTGGSANDLLVGGVGNDTLSGGQGNDRLEGGVGDDTYVFTGGQDVLKETSGADTLRFGAGITFNQVASGLTKSGDDLVLKVNGGPDQVTLTGFFLGGGSVVETIEFETGGQITSDQIFGAFGMSEPTPATSSLEITEGTSGDDSSLAGSADADLVQGFGGNDSLSGGGGNDQLEGGNGHDSLSGGVGSDTLIGGRGNDTYLFSAGDGQDVIDNVGGGNDTLRFEDISFNQVASGLMKSGNDLVLQVGGGSDSVTIQDFFSGGDRSIDQIEFGPGGQLTSSQIFGAFGLNNPDPQGSPEYQGLPDQRGFGNLVNGTASADNILASSDADFVDGGAGDDVLSGGLGDDYLLGGEGNDTYQFASGDGHDTINNLSNGAGDDQLHFASGIDESQLWFSRDGDDLVTSVLGSDDQVRVQDWFSNDAQKLDSIHTDDASITANQLEQLVTAMASFGDPAAGEVTLTPQEESQVQSAIASSWQPS
ncbi:calcium-binding protein [Marinobacter nauticus]|uniref:calcium-binding protein n=1 Tax=Marinobacter nauticus TaxID=2743 RepID=UPI001CFC6A07|nr:calcium-binding protein [Marinobacter nauticus]